MTNPTRDAGCLGFCGDKTYGQISAMLHHCYDHKHPELTPWKVEDIHRRWTRIGKLTKAGRL